MRIDHHQLQRGMLYAALIREHDHGVERWERTSKAFETRFSGFCGDCGYPIEVDEQAAQGRLGMSAGVVHLECPAWEVRYEALFEIHGDLILQVMFDPSDQNCYICEARLVSRSLLLANPSPYGIWWGEPPRRIGWRRAAYVCEKHRVYVKKALSLEDRRADALGLPHPMTDRGLPSRL
jgi:hypothetical protein